MTLAVFDITKVVEDGRVIEPEAEQTSGTVRLVFSPMTMLISVNTAYSHPKPFKCSIKPRSAEAEALILGAENN